MVFISSLEMLETLHQSRLIVLDGREGDGKHARRAEIGVNGDLL